MGEWPLEGAREGLPRAEQGAGVGIPGRVAGQRRSANVERGRGQNDVRSRQGQGVRTEELSEPRSDLCVWWCVCV